MIDHENQIDPIEDKSNNSREILPDYLHIGKKSTEIDMKDRKIYSLPSRINHNFEHFSMQHCRDDAILLITYANWKIPDIDTRVEH